MGLGVETIVTGRWRENCHVVYDGGGGACVIDPGDDGEAIIARMERMGLRPGAILNTHAHYDHVGAVCALKEKYGIAFHLHSRDEALLKHANLYRKLFDGSPGAPIPAVDGYLDGAREIRVEGLTFQLIEAPGHTPGGICFSIGTFLFTGDVLFKRKIGRTDLPGGDREALRATLNRLSRLAPETILLPGHGDPSVLGEELSGNAFLRDAVR